ncbi:MAG: cupin domain-containing protein [Planctomycetes bacterium]|nr:cupin domain-containing protein [Planctomycetota bacterium]
MSDLQLKPEITSLIGGLGMTRVTVYEDTQAPDGKHSGCPHLHAISSEAYYVLHGKGEVELHSLNEGFRTEALKPGQYLQFPSNTLHRIISHGGLVVLGLMSNAGLAENGDARIYFGEAADNDQKKYTRNNSLVKLGLEGALQRRDIAVRAYLNLLDLWQNNREAYFEDLKRFINTHRHAVHQQKSKLEPYIDNGPSSWAQRTRELLDNPESHPMDTVIKDNEHTDPLLGMCGTLQPIRTT